LLADESGAPMAFTVSRDLTEKEARSLMAPSHNGGSHAPTMTHLPCVAWVCLGCDTVSLRLSRKSACPIRGRLDKG